MTPDVRPYFLQENNFSPFVYTENTINGWHFVPEIQFECVTFFYLVAKLKTKKLLTIVHSGKNIVESAENHQKQHNTK